MTRLITAVAILVLVAAAVVAVRHYDAKPTSSTTSSTSSTTTSTSSTTTSTAALAGCSGADFTGTLQAGQGAAGTIFASVLLVNNSSLSCTLDGWPALSLFSPSGATMSSAIIQSATQFTAVSGVPGAPSTVTVAAGAAAGFELSYSDIPSGNQTTCPVVGHFTVTFPTIGGVSPTAISVTAGGSFAPCDQATINVSPLYLP